ncbi:hypothetical protein [Sphingomonas hengshuiensis]|uniref:Peptidase M23 n=1 Tax=Sphingomonas hengshuiensis TaxID=1609977 RepID=A0A7U4J6G9_9SPHN|nr:hypothetical protein [Sphingomonas hengshuiensis]AJP71138.1 hypothetical protein TS85_03835 [Sphingomonas hengshuiensis]
MKRSLIIGSGAAVLLLCSTQAQAQAQAQTAGAGGLAPEQAQQLIATLTQRNAQLRELAARIREMEAQVAAGREAVKERENARKALVIAAQKNRELVEIAEAILDDYQKMDLGKRVAAREPLTQLYRVRLENKLQAFHDEIAAQGFYPQRELDALQAPAAAPVAPPAQ